MKPALYAALAAICPRVFPMYAPHGTVTPYVTYQRYGGEVVNFLGDEQPDLRNGLWQINVWAEDPQQADTIMRQIEPALRASTAFIARPTGEARDMDEADMNLYGSSQDFSIWFNG